MAKGKTATKAPKIRPLGEKILVKRLKVPSWLWAMAGCSLTALGASSR